MANVSPCVIAANTCDLSPTAKMPAALLSLFSLCPLLFTLPWPKDSSEALLSRLVLLCHTLQTTLSSLVRPWCPGSCDRHVSSFPDRKKHMKPSEHEFHLRFMGGMVEEREGWAALAFGLLFSQPYMQTVAFRPVCYGSV